MSKLTFKHYDNDGKQGYSVFAGGVAYIGDAIASDDGFYYFWPDLSRGGYWPSWILRELAFELDSLNNAWEMEIENFFSKGEREDPATDGAETLTGKQSGLDF